MKTVNIKNISYTLSGNGEYKEIIFFFNTAKNKYLKTLKIELKELNNHLKNIGDTNFLNLVFYIENLFKNNDFKIIGDLHLYYLFFKKLIEYYNQSKDFGLITLTY